MTKKIFKVNGMHCASCASIITKKVAAMAYVNSIDVNFATEKATIDFDDANMSIIDLNRELEKLGYVFSTIETVETPLKSADSGDFALESMKNKSEFMLPISLFVFFIMLWEIFVKIFAWVPNLPIPMIILNMTLWIISSVALFWVGSAYLSGVVRFVRYKVANMDTLIGIGTLVAYIYSSIVFFVPSISELLRIPNYTYFDVTIVVIGFITLGKYLEANSKRKTGDAIEKLLNLQAKTALVIRDGIEIEVAVSEVKHDEIIVIKPGVRMPVDGVVIDGESFVDESMVTGEPMPIRKKSGDTVVSGTINTTGFFTYRATKIGSETLLSQIIRMVEEAQGSKAPIQALADKISSVFVPIVLVLAVVTFASWIIIGSRYIGFSQALSFGLVSFVGVLIIACPCALGLATPTAIIVGVGKGAKEGILIKDAATLEKLHKVDTVVVDKTGTITRGKPTVVDLKNISTLTDNKLLTILASLEKQSEHPIAAAVLNYATEKKISLMNVSNFESLSGKGLKGVIDGVEYFVGNLKLMKDIGVVFDTSSIEQFTAQGKTPVILAGNGGVLGFVMVSDEVKTESAEAVKNLHKLGISVVMLTGDDDKAARYIASLVGIDDVISNVLPQDKLEKIKTLQEQGKIVAMAGDGVNDAPALAQADVGVAMGTGTDVAIESAGMTLLGGDISKLVKAIKLSKMTMRGIKQNLFWAFIYNVVGIPLAAGAFYPVFGWLLNPVFAGFAMAMSSVSVVSNSLRIKSKKL